MTHGLRPELAVLSKENITRIIDEAWKVLDVCGVLFENREAVEILTGHGFSFKTSTGRIHFNRNLAEPLLTSVPEEIQIYDRSGKPACIAGGKNVNFDPGSAAVFWLDPNMNLHRRATTRDCIHLAWITDLLDGYALQSTGIVPSDVPEIMSDFHRMFIALTFASKPIVTGTFKKESFKVMLDLLTVVRGSESSVASKPAAIFDCCPSPPLKWSDLTVSALIDCARSQIPAELVSMPLAGATSPVTLYGAIVQHTAESLSGAILHQAAGKGSPIIWGGSPAAFDMRHGTTPMGAMETMLIDLGYAQIGKTLRLPTHAYMACSDSKTIDYQAGMESAMGAILAALGGINIVSGPGFLNYENTQSLEKLILDNDAIHLVDRLIQGIDPNHPMDVCEVIARNLNSGSFLADITTRKLHRQEISPPGTTVSRNSMERWIEAGSPDSRKAAQNVLDRLLHQKPDLIPYDQFQRLYDIMLTHAESAHFKANYSELVEREIGPFFK